MHTSPATGGCAVDDGPPRGHGVLLRLPRTRTMAIVAASIVAVLFVMGVLAIAVHHLDLVFFGAEDQFVRLFNLDSELSVPATVSSLGLAACALLLCVIAAVQRASGAPFVHRNLVQPGGCLRPCPGGQRRAHADACAGLGSIAILADTTGAATVCSTSAAWPAMAATSARSRYRRSASPTSGRRRTMRASRSSTSR